MKKIFSDFLSKPVDKRRVTLLLSLCLLAAGFISVVYFRAQSISPLSPQSRFMLARSLSLYGTIDPDIYPGAVWPPGYPLVLLMARYVHFPVEMVNLVLFFVTLFFVYIISKEIIPDTSPLWATMLFGLSAFNYYNLPQYTAESLVLPLSLLILLTMVKFQQGPSYWMLLFLSLGCSLLFITRYHAMLWLAPIVLGNLLYMKFKLRNVSFGHLLFFLVMAFLPICAVLLINYHNTGFLTGMSRFDWSSRESSAYIEYFASSTTLTANLTRTVRIFLLDFGSPFVYATHFVLRYDYRMTIFEIGSAVIFTLTMGILVLALVEKIKKRESVRNILRPWGQQFPPKLYIFEFLLVYLFITILFWTIGNNDPLYTRYLYPSYIYLIFAVYSGYSFIKQQYSSMIPRIPYWVLYAYILTMNLYKILYTVFLQNKLV